MQVARWLHTRLATTISRKSWHLLSKHRAYTITSLALLRVHFQIGHLSTEQSDKRKPYAATDAQGQTVRNWERHVNEVVPAGYLAIGHTSHCCRTDCTDTRSEGVTLLSGESTTEGLKAVHRNPRRYPKILSEV